MRIEFLGTGGAVPPPRPGCECRICKQAQQKGIPYSRTGPGIFVHGPDILIDTSEDIRTQLLRAGIGEVPACIYSHWHPDHTMGRRIWESLNADLHQWPSPRNQTDIYLPQQVAEDFREHLGGWEHLQYLERLGLIRVIALADGDFIQRNRTTIRPFRLAQDYVYAFLFEEAGRRVLIAPDELCDWDPPHEVHGVDLAVIPMGLVEFNPFTGERQFPEDHPLLKWEATFAETLDMVRQMRAGRVIMTHIEEVDQVGYDDLLRLEERLRGEGLDITFAYDTLQVEVG